MSEEPSCRHCGKPIVWDDYWTSWEHTGRTNGLVYVELCEPNLGFEKSTYAAPPRKEVSK